MRRNFPLIIIAILFGILIFGGAIAKFYTNWLWFGEVGYRTVFWTGFTSRLALGLLAGALFFIIVYANILLARKFAPPSVNRRTRDDIRVRIGDIASRGINLAILLGTIFVSVLVGLEASTHWLGYQTFTNAGTFGTTDPIFNRDIGFYVFKLGFLKYIYGWLFFTLIVAAIATAAVHYLDRAIDVLAGVPTFAPHVKAHLSLLLAAALLIKAWGYRLNAYDLLYSPTGVVFGPGYTDVHARLPVLNILSVIAVIAAIIALVNIRRRGVALPLVALGILFGSAILLGGIYPGLVQQFRVKPNEISLESPYIKHNINMTRSAFSLDKIETSNFPVQNDLTAADIRDNQATINSIRLWDYRPIQSTYSQLQALWQYYVIQNVDIDRYTINGDLRQVMLSARELSSESAQTDAGTWVNRHFQYTHGYGAVMSPVNRATEEGLPDFFVKDIPPVSNVGINITQPQIYFGEETTNYVVVNSDEQEFDYPSQDQPVYTKYAGKGGVPVGGFLNKLAFAWRFSDFNLILKNPISSNSRLMFQRDIKERVQAIFPFLLYDNDPYLVISNGKLFWMWDAYTVSQAYPYSTPYAIGEQGPRINYIRNAVKVVIDAYDGSVDYYTADTEDPIIQTYARIFPGVFKPLDQMPADLQTHIRYPEMLFRLQSDAILTYHMLDPQVFYNKGDRWAVPNEIVGTTGEEQEIEPYYVVMRLPGEESEEFILMRPFTPQNKNNMVAWMAAKSGPEDYGKVILYQFPKDRLIYGPSQIESRINQDSTISPQLTLWNQSGTRVNRGNMLIIPIKDSVIYVKPLYLESETSKIPELKRVIVSYSGQVVMEPTLEAALNRIFGGGAAQPQPTQPAQAAPRPQPSAPGATPAAPSPAGNTDQLIQQANRQFDQAQEAQRRGDWAEYGRQIDALEQTLRQLQEQNR